MSDQFAHDVAAVQNIEVVSKILDVICRTTGMGFAAVARVTPDRWVACAVRDEIAFGLRPGGELDVKTTICDEIRSSDTLVAINHVATDAKYCLHHTPAMYGFQSYISVPLRRPDGSFFGTLCAIDPAPAQVDNVETIGMFTLFADLIGYHLAAQEQLFAREQALSESREDAGSRERSMGASDHDSRRGDHSTRAIAVAVEGTTPEFEARVRDRTDELRRANVALEHQLREQRAARARVAGLLQQVQTAQEDERRRIAREIHDQLGQPMTAVRMQLEALRLRDDASGLAEPLSDLSRLAEELDRSVDFLTWQLRPTVVEELGISEALANLVDDWGHQFHLGASYQAEGLDGLRLSLHAETHLYRIVQEALQNVYKHAAASQVRVRLWISEGILNLRVADDGCGIGASGQQIISPGMGIANMRDRAVLAGAELFVFWSTAGTTIDVRLPIMADHSVTPPETIPERPHR